VARQAFSAGVGNWVADEVLYQARIHPEQKANSLGAEQAAALHAQLQGVLQVEQPPGAGRPAGNRRGVLVAAWRVPWLACHGLGLQFARLQ